MSRARASVLVLLLATSALWSAPASAQVPWYGLWDGMSLQFNYNDASFTTGGLALASDFTSVRNHLTAATFTWMQPGCTVVSVGLADSTTSLYEHGVDPADFENVLYYETDSTRWEQLNHADATVYGNTHFTRDTERPWFIADADIIFNGSGITDRDGNGTDWILDGSSAVRIDFESVALHEMGHALGLLHDEVPGESIMFPAIFNGEVHRTLRQADVAAVCFLYPNPFSMAGMSSECTTDHDCATGTCATIGTTQSCQYRCGSDCDCPSGQACTPTATTGVSVCQPGTNTCPPSSAPSLAQNGAACTHGIECVSNLCYQPASGSSYCSHACSSDCDCNAMFACDPTEGICVTATGATHCIPDGGMMSGDAGVGSMPPASHGGCSVARDARGSIAWLVALGAAVVLTMRRRPGGARRH